MAVRTVEDHDTGPVDERGVAAVLGSALRRLRKGRGLTLRQLAERCGLSQPFLSQIENGKAMPSLTALHRLARALGTTAHELLHPQAEAEVSLVRRGEGSVYQLADGATVRFLTSRSARRLEPNEVEFEPGARTENTGHTGEEVIYILEGRLQVEIEGYGRIELASGDAFLYPAAVPHVLSTDETRACRFLIITSPPSF